MKTQLAACYNIWQHVGINADISSKNKCCISAYEKLRNYFLSPLGQTHLVISAPTSTRLLEGGILRQPWSPGGARVGITAAQPR